MPVEERKYVDAVSKAYEGWFGAPSDVVRLEPAPKSKGPRDMAVVIYLPDDTPEGTTSTMFATAGMSAEEMNGPLPLAELGYEVKGTVPKDEIKKVAKRLAELASVPFQTGKGYKLNSIVEGAKVPPFEGFDALYLLDWDPYQQLHPKDFDKAVPLLRIVPLFEAEAQFIEAAKDRNRAYLSLKRKGLDPADYQRAAVV